MSKLKVNEFIQIDPSEFDISFSKSSGPGGQNVNKSNTKARVAWNLFETKSLPTEIAHKIIWQNLSRVTKDGVLIVDSDKFREQRRNLQECFVKIISICRKAAKGEKRRVPTKPTQGSDEKRLNSKKQRSQKKKRRRSVDSEY